ncbi:MAG: HAD-IA family hydrolase [Marinifilaceae bacterium]|jgi:phosphoglycolate phosphatase|nr:HAD-IA family hydrolase [Marinifilaceae bacterium]
MFKAVIFDLDGTLVDSIYDISDSANIALEKNNFPTHDIESYKKFVGNGVRKLMRDALGGNCTEEAFNKCFKEFMEVYADNCTNKTRPYDGIDNFLSQLNKRGIKMAVLSNKVNDLTQKVVKDIFSKYGIENAYGACDSIPRKPDPTGLFKLMDDLDVDKKSCLFVGDSEADIRTAKNAGIKVAGVCWGYRTKEVLITEAADYIVEHPSELIDIVIK